MSEQKNTGQSSIDALSWLTLNPENSEDAYQFVAGLSDQERSDLLSLADSNHVILRALKPLHERATRGGNLAIATWAENGMAAERARIVNMLEHMERVCQGLEASGCPTTVMKTLDHWPDIGNDIDMYSTADDDRIVQVMKEQVNAAVEPRSWGDRLAHKWNFAIPGLKEPVEIHVRRLGQTGEHTDLAKRFVSRRQQKTVDDKAFWVPAPEERIVAATLQRMYRHFYFRVCDIVNTANLVESGTINYGELKRVSNFAGIWPGVATYLMIVSGYVERYRGQAPSWELWNEPDNEGGTAYPKSDARDKNRLVAALLPQVFSWARAQDPLQPLTSGLWKSDWVARDAPSAFEQLQIEQSDVLSLHSYSWPEDFEQSVHWLQRYHRPVLCTEYMARTVGSTFDQILPVAKRLRVAAIGGRLPITLSPQLRAGHGLDR